MNLDCRLYCPRKVCLRGDQSSVQSSRPLYIGRRWSHKSAAIVYGKNITKFDETGSCEQRCLSLNPDESAVVLREPDRGPIDIRPEPLKNIDVNIIDMKTLKYTFNLEWYASILLLGFLRLFGYELRKMCQKASVPKRRSDISDIRPKHASASFQLRGLCENTCFPSLTYNTSSVWS